MEMAMINALALLRWHGHRYFRGTLGLDDMTWLVLIVVIVLVVVLVGQRRRRRWF
jgi:hypothetical protein